MQLMVTLMVGCYDDGWNTVVVGTDGPRGCKHTVHKYRNQLVVLGQSLVQKQRRRKPWHLPPEKPSFLQTRAQLWLPVQGPLNLWLCDLHTLPSTFITTLSREAKIITSNMRSPNVFLSISIYINLSAFFRMHTSYGVIPTYLYTLAHTYSL